jgi:hypothetical protein
VYYKKADEMSMSTIQLAQAIAIVDKVFNYARPIAAIYSACAMVA